MKQPTTDQLAAALKVFIISGSADGREEMRAVCKKLVPIFAAAPKLLAACNLVMKRWESAKINHLTVEEHQSLITAISEAERKS